MSQFNRTTQAPVNAAAVPPRGASRTLCSAIQVTDVKDPMLDVGTYRVTVLGYETGYNPVKRRESFKARIRVDEAADGSVTAVGDQCVFLALDTDAGVSEMMRFLVAAGGYGVGLGENLDKQGLWAAVDAFNAAYPGADLSAPGTLQGLVGRQVDVAVTRGKDVTNPTTGQSTGDFYRNYRWAVA